MRIAVHDFVVASGDAEKRVVAFRPYDGREAVDGLYGCIFQVLCAVLGDGMQLAHQTKRHRGWRLGEGDQLFSKRGSLLVMPLESSLNIGEASRVEYPGEQTGHELAFIENRNVMTWELSLNTFPSVSELFGEVLVRCTGNVASGSKMGMRKNFL